MVHKGNGYCMSSSEFSGDDLTKVLRVLERATARENVAFISTNLNLADLSHGLGSENIVELLERCAPHAGLIMREIKLNANEAKDVLSENMVVLVVVNGRMLWLLERLVGKSVEAAEVSGQVQIQLLEHQQLDELLSGKNPVRTFVLDKELGCSELSSIASMHDDVAAGGGGDRHHGHHHGHDHDHHHRGPLSRFFSLLRLDLRDIWMVILFALVIGVLSLATPLAVEALVNVVSWGTYLQPLLVLGTILLACLGLAGFLTILQNFVVEIIQRRQFVRIVSDLAHRFPRARQSDLTGLYPREYANRVFDVMTIQKACATLLLEGISIILITILGMTLLAFYHPFLLGFDLVLVICMVSMTWILGRGGIQAAIDESITKYRVAHWLQDVISAPTAFKVNGGETLAVERTNQLTTAYILARQKQYRIYIRQFAFAVGLEAVASAVILGLGGWLVIQQQLTLGQLVASELVVTVVVGAFTKAAKLAEKFYDLMAALDKVGHLLDISVDTRQEVAQDFSGPAELRWSELGYELPNSPRLGHCSSQVIKPGARVALVGNCQAGKTMLIRSLAGLEIPATGSVEINGVAAMQVVASSRSLVGYSARIEVVHESIAMNVSLGRTNVGLSHIRDAFDNLGLADSSTGESIDINTWLQSDGYPLSRVQLAQLVLARAIVGSPRLLLIDGTLDLLPSELRQRVWAYLSDKSRPWTLIVNTHDPNLIGQCEQTVPVSF